MNDKKNAISHLRQHQKYPATKAELIAECDNLSDFSSEDKEWFMKSLTKDSYTSADEVIADLGLEDEMNTEDSGNTAMA